MTEELMTKLIELVSQGGTAAAWLFIVYQITGVVKFLISFGALGYIVKKIAEETRGHARDKLEARRH